MAPRNTVDLLPQPIRDAAYELLRGGKTIDEIVAHLNGMGAAEGVQVSRSGVGRWKKSATKSMKALQRAQAFGAEWAKSLKEDPEGKIGRLLVELGKTAALDVMLDRVDDGESEEAQPMDVKSLFFLSSAVKNFESASNMNVKRELAITKEVLDKAAKAVDQVGKAKGLSKDVLAEVRAKILGVAT